MKFDPQLSVIRFGLGLGPRHNAPRNVASLVDEIYAAPRHTITPFSQQSPTMADIRQERRERRASIGTDRENIVAEKGRAMRRSIAAVRDQGVLIRFARAVDAQTGIAERLTAFWADHFTVLPRNGVAYHLITGYVEEAIRPHIGGKFRDMLRQATLHPMMLLFLEQAQSVGANSRFGKRRGRGANENLAREILELHSLGVDGPYTQADVSEFADLLTGLHYTAEKGFSFDARGAEPGSETVMGVTYARQASLDNVLTALDDLADHPSTATHLAFKMAQHFVDDEPPADLVSAMAASFTASDGHLGEMVTTMLDHPAAWGTPMTKIKPPDHFIASGFRALGVQGTALIRADRRLLRMAVMTPMRVMGQSWQRASGPDGWPEVSRNWITPQAMAGRINWAMQVPLMMMKGRLPDPRDFVQSSLGRHASADVIFAAGAAEGREEGIGVVLASPAFQRS